MPDSKNIPDLRAYLLRVNDPASNAVECGHACRVWSDLECTMEKGGSLLGMRNLHCVSAPQPQLAIDPTLFPNIGSNGFGFVWCSYENMKGIFDALCDRDT